MTERRIEIVMSAQDDYSAALNKFNAALGESEGAAASAGRGTDKLSRQLDGLTSANDWAAGGVKKFKNILEGMAFGGALGLVSGGVSAFTEMLIEAYKTSGMTADKLSSLNGELVQQATNWKMIEPAVGGATSAVIDYYNARLNLAQFEGVQRIAEIQSEIKKQETLQKNYEINAKAFPQRTELTRTAKEYGVSLAGLRLELASLNTVAALTPTTLKQVRDSIDQASIKAPELKVPENKGSLAAFIMGGLDMPEIVDKVGFAGLELGKTFATSFAAGQAEADPFAVGDLNYNQKYITRLEDDLAYNEAYFALLDERYAREAAHEEAMLDRNLSYSMQRFQIEQAGQQYLMNMRFAAGNQALALMHMVGQKSKALALAALAFQKGLAIAQVWIQTQTASAAALAPPPLGLGPVFGAPLAASVQFWGKIQMGLIAATGIAEAAMGGGSPSGVGGGGGVGSLPIAPPSATVSAPAPSITIQIYNPMANEDWDRLAEEEIVPAIKRASGRNVTI